MTLVVRPSTDNDPNKGAMEGYSVLVRAMKMHPTWTGPSIAILSCRKLISAKPLMNYLQ